MGHNTSFLTRVANNVIYILNDAQFAQLKTLATAQLDADQPLRLQALPADEGLPPRCSTATSPPARPASTSNAVKKASRELYLIDGQISFDRALLYANVLDSLDATQKAYLDAMKGKGWNSWPDVTDDAGPEPDGRACRRARPWP